LLLALSLFLATSSALCSEEEKGETWISGKVIWPGHDLSKASVEVFKDPQFKEIYTRGLLLKQEGIYALTIEKPGTYYIVAFVDDNDNSQFDAGDGMGIYGVMDWSDSQQKPAPVEVKSGMKLPGIDIQITSVVNDQGRMVPVFSSGSGLATGISGKLIWPNHKFRNAILFVYSDPSWNNRIAQTDVSETGEYEVAVPPGRYYILAVIDENETNLLDVGDKFGVLGITRFGMFPKAVKVDKDSIATDKNILIIGQMGISGQLVPLEEAAKGTPTPAETMAPRDKVVLSGSVVWPGHDFSSGIVQAYGDPSMTVAVAQARTGDEGSFQLAVPVGDYYIIAGIDSDGDGKYTKGDGIGAYGVTDATEQMPKKLNVTGQSADKRINVVITAEFDESGQLIPVSQSTKTLSTIQHPAFQDARRKTQDTGQQEKNSDLESSVLSLESLTGISGKILWEGRRISEATLVFSQDQEFESGIKTSLQLEEDGSYECLTPPGDYYIMAIVDISDNDGTASGDGRGFYGTGYRGSPQRVAVLEGNITPFINISVTESLGEDGLSHPVQTRGSIRFWYGEPDDIHTDDSEDPPVQKWRYWDKGVVFTFQETDAGWNLIDTYEFDPAEARQYVQPPEEELKTPQPEQDSSRETIYYTFDRIIWAMDPDGADQRRVALGVDPTATLDGERLFFVEESGSMYLMEIGNGSSPKLVLSEGRGGVQLAISHNGKVLAFTRESGGYNQIILKNLDTLEESALPVADMDVYNPAWSSDDELIAYSASPAFSSDQPDRNRDIYYYDLVAKRTERVSTSPLDEFDPAWSPSLDKRALVYCRAEGAHAQLWIVDFDAQGVPTERQLTKYGGRNPAWSPQGNKIVYESNAQLWTINPDGSEEAPIAATGEPIFGLDPFWIR
jgi:hypothetical protein